MKMLYTHDGVSLSQEKIWGKKGQMLLQINTKTPQLLYSIVLNNSQRHRWIRSPSYKKNSHIYFRNSAIIILIIIIIPLEEKKIKIKANHSFSGWHNNGCINKLIIRMTDVQNYNSHSCGPVSFFPKNRPYFLYSHAKIFTKKTS